MDGFQMESIESAAAAADLFISNTMAQLPNTNYTLPKLRRQIPPFYPIRWNRPAITAIGANRLLLTFTRVRQSKPPKGEFTDFARLGRLQCIDSSALLPFSLDSWRSFFIQFNLDSASPLPERIATLSILRERLIEATGRFSRLFRSRYSNVRREFPLSRSDHSPLASG